MPTRDICAKQAALMNEQHDVNVYMTIVKELQHEEIRNGRLMIYRHVRARNVAWEEAMRMSRVKSLQASISRFGSRGNLTGRKTGYKLSGGRKSRSVGVESRRALNTGEIKSIS